MTRIPSRAQRICEIINTEKEYAWKLTDFPWGGTHISYAFRYGGDECEVHGYYFEDDGSLDLRVLINDSHTPTLFLVSPEKIAQRSQAAIKCMSLLFSLVTYAFAHYNIKRIDFDPHGWNVFSHTEREDPRIFRTFERFGQALAKKYHGVYMRNHEYRWNHPTYFSIYFGERRRRVLELPRDIPAANDT